MTSHCITWHDTTQAITSHQMTWPSHDLTPQQTSRHQNTSLQSTKHHHHGTAEGSFTAKKWFGHRAGRSPCAHSIGKFFLCYIVLFLLETSAPGLSGYYWYILSLYFWKSFGDAILACHVAAMPLPRVSSKDADPRLPSVKELRGQARDVSSGRPLLGCKML